MELPVTETCRECGGAVNCQHCHPVQLPRDRERIAELEAELAAIKGGDAVVMPANIQHAEAMHLIADQYIRDRRQMQSKSCIGS